MSRTAPGFEKTLEWVLNNYGPILAAEDIAKIEKCSTRTVMSRYHLWDGKNKGKRLTAANYAMQLVLRNG